jgi:two-component system, OmpR family, sensor kinase
VSLHRRLVALMAILLIAGLVAADIATYASVRSFLYGRADDQLASSEGLAFNYLTFASSHKNPVTAADLSRHVSPDVYVIVIDAKGHTVVQRPSGSPLHPDPAPLLTRSIRVQSGIDNDNDHFGRSAGAYRPDPNAVVVGAKGDRDAQYRAVAVEVPQGTLVSALSLNPTLDTLASLRRVELLASLAVILSIGILAFGVVRRGLRPLRNMAETADAIASGDLTRRVAHVEEPPSTEVGRLGVALNEMLTQIEGAFTEKSASEERLRQFVADASHELRTPLTSIRGYAELLGRGGFSDEAGKRKALNRIEEEATRMGGLVEDLLLLAELDRGRPLRPEAVDVQRVCADVVDDSNAVAHGHQLTLQEGAPVVVMGDPGRLAQVAHNLVRNALVHTPAGTAVVVSTGVDGDMGLIRVTDHGPGVSAVDAPRVFDRFYRGDPARSGVGTGLGLPIVRAIAKALGGSAGVTTSPQGGAVFEVRLPLSGTHNHGPLSAGPATPTGPKVGPTRSAQIH